ncbi:MAG: hypothetical protein ACREM1_24790 [Longimicrobiales bacterium]
MNQFSPAAAANDRSVSNANGNIPSRAIYEQLLAFVQGDVAADPWRQGAEREAMVAELKRLLHGYLAPVIGS